VFDEGDHDSTDQDQFRVKKKVHQRVRKGRLERRGLGMRSRGFYVGTLRMEQPWYRRGVTQAGFPGKGAGEYWYDYKGFYFVRDNTGRGLVIPSESIIEVKLGFWHGTTFSRGKVLKVIWRSGRERLSSGFVVRDPEHVKQALTTAGWA
jgi:hypothetical protein